MQRRSVREGTSERAAEKLQHPEQTRPQRVLAHNHHILIKLRPLVKVSK